MKHSSLAKDIHAKTSESIWSYALQYWLWCARIFRDRKFLQIIQGELAKTTSELREIHEHIKNDSKKFRGQEDDFTYSKEQRQLYKYGLEELETE